MIERAALVAGDGPIEAHHILLDAAAAAVAAAAPGDDVRDRLLAALEQCAGNQTRAARLLGVSRSTLVRKMLVHHVPRPRCG